MIALLQALLDGVLNGGVYGVLAVGLSLVFGILGIVNFAHAQFVTIGMYVAWLAWHLVGLNPLAGALLSLAVGGLLGMAIQYTLVRFVVHASPLAQIFLTVGLIAVLENGMLILFGADSRSVQTAYQTSALRLGPLLVSVPYLLAFIAAVVVSILLRFVLERTWLGRAIRAAAQNEAAATSFGIDTKFVYAIAFGIGTGLTAFGGGIILPYATVSPSASETYIVLMFTVAVLGGLGTTMGALVGGVIVGVIQSLSTLVMPVQMRDLALFVIFIAILAFRPQGLLGSACTMIRAVLIVAATCAVVLPIGSQLQPGGYAMRVLCILLLAASMAQAWNIVGGLANQISLGNSVFFGIGAYASTIAQTAIATSPWIGLAGGMIGAAAFALLLSLPTLRLKGPYFALATLAAAEAGKIIASTLAVTGGPQGVSVPFAGDSLANMQFRQPGGYLPLLLGLLAVISLAFAALSNGRVGYFLRAVRDDEQAAERTLRRVAGKRFPSRTTGTKPFTPNHITRSELRVPTAPNCRLSQRTDISARRATGCRSLPSIRSIVRSAQSRQRRHRASASASVCKSSRR